jgi:DNA-directed RNA polymerase specialized sigma24 family protein
MSTPPVPVEHALDVAAQIDAAFRTIAQFPEARRTAMTLYWRNDLSVAEIAEVMEISQNAVYLHLNRGLHALKHLLPHPLE